MRASDEWEPDSDRLPCGCDWDAICNVLEAVDFDICQHLLAEDRASAILGRVTDHGEWYPTDTRMPCGCEYYALDRLTDECDDHCQDYEWRQRYAPETLERER